ncbi:HNH endonuclease [Vibrio phage D69]
MQESNHFYVHGFTGHPLHTQWCSMRRRAKKRKSSIYAEWDDFPAFHKYCMENGWKEGLCICRGTPDNPDQGIYEPGNIYFATAGENTVHAWARHHLLIDPEGEEVEVYNLAEFCRDNYLDHSAMCKVVLGERPRHKGWSL